MIKPLTTLLFAIVFLSFANNANSQPNFHNLIKPENATTYTNVEEQLIKDGFVDISTLEPSIAVYMVYSTPYNFMGRKLYNGITHAFMVDSVANRLIRAQKLLKSLRPDLSLIVYDAARPIAVQHDMWNMVKGTSMSDFVANPNNGNGLHNYGLAVDVTLLDCAGNPLAMGSEYDYFGDEARTNNEDLLLSSGLITKRELNNRLLLRKVMTSVGFRTITSEWWHFNYTTSSDAKQNYKIIN